MTLQQLKYLIAIADCGLNITAAAERLYTSQPGISKQLKLLEQELGVQLFTRKGKSLTEVTSAGHDVIARARRIMREVENIRSLASDLSGEEVGTLAIATTHTQARHVLPDVIKTFRERYPGINLEMHQGTSEQLAELVAANRVDFAIATGSRQLFPGLVMLPCFQWDRIILVPKDHPLTRLAGQDDGQGGDQRGGVLDLAQLAKYPLVTYVFPVTGESSFKKAFAEQGLEPNVVFTARDADIIKTYVRMGLGVGVVAPMAYEEQDQKDLTALSAEHLFPRVTTWLGFRRDSVLRGYMVEFITRFAPHLTPYLIRKAAQASTQAEVDAMFDDGSLPIRTGYEAALAD